MSPKTLAYPPVDPIAQLPQWTKTLEQIARQDLEFCPGFPQIARRYEAWWSQAVIDRPIFVATANGNPARPVTRRLDLLDKPDQWFEAKLQDVKQIRLAGDALPNIRVDFGPVLVGSLVGGQTEIGSDTTWTHSFINDQWSNAPDWSLREDHPWWSLLRQLLARVAEDAKGRYLVATPDLGGSADVLLNLRGSSELCLDAIERPELVRHHVDAIYPAWRKTFVELYDKPIQRGAGVIHWLTLWSSRPYMVPACDFNFMIGPAEFEAICLPDIARQAATVGRAIFHLDGPGAARHIDALLELPELQAIQFTPGEGTPSALAWIDMFKKIQSKGKSFFVIIPAGEVLEFCRALPPEGMGLWVSGVSSPKELDNLYQEFNRLYQR